VGREFGGRFAGEGKDGCHEDSCWATVCEGAFGLLSLVVIRPCGWFLGMDEAIWEMDAGYFGRPWVVAVLLGVVARWAPPLGWFCWRFLMVGEAASSF